MIINNITELREYIPTTVALEWEDIKLCIENDAEIEFFSSAIGPELFDYLATYIANNTPPYTLEHGSAINLSRIAIANYAMFIFADQSGVRYGKAGPFRAETEGSKTPYQYQLKAQKQIFINRAYTALESLLFKLVYIYPYNTFPSWDGSVIRYYMMSSFIRNSKEFDQYFSIKHPCRLFYRMTHLFKRFETDIILPILGKPLFDELKAALELIAWTNEQETLWHMIQKAEAHAVMADALVELPLSIEPDGIYLNSEYFNRENQEVKNPATENQKGALEMKCKILRDKYIEEIVAYLYANPVAFPLHTQSENYVDPNTPVVALNTTDNKSILL